MKTQQPLLSRAIRAALVVACLEVATAGHAAAIGGVAAQLKTLIGAGRPAEAYALAAQRPQDLGDPSFDFYFGIAAIDSGHAAEGTLALERYLSYHPESRQGRVELARGYFLAGDLDRARDEFEKVRGMSPPPAVAEKVDGYLAVIRARQARYRTTMSGYLELGVGYDSNVNGGAADANVVLPVLGPVALTDAGVEKEDGFGYLGGAAQISHPVTTDTALFAGIGADGHINWHENAFDQGNLGLGAGLAHEAGNNRLRITGALGRAWVGDTPYRDLVGGALEWGHKWDSERDLAFTVQTAQLDYTGTNAIRDSRLSGAAMTYRWTLPIAGKTVTARASLGFSREANRRNRDDLSRDIPTLGAGLTFAPAPRWNADLGVSVQQSHYDAADPLLGVTREDDYAALRLALAYRIDRKTSVATELNATRNQSNIALYDYTKNTALVKLRYDFQ